MQQYDFYDPVHHIGNLPVRVLPYTYIDWFQNVTPDFLEELKSEIEYNDLNRNLLHNTKRTKIIETASISSSNVIELNENFNQYLWCICYSLMVIFIEGIEKPMYARTYNGLFDTSNSYLTRANDVFNNGFALLSTYKDKEFFALPNPEKYDENDKSYIEMANGIFAAAMTFILLHEYAHNYYGHVKFSSTSLESIKDEFLCDEFAIDKIGYNFSSDKSYVYKFGIIAGISSLMIMNKSLSGGDTHPDNDARLKVAIEKMNLVGPDDPLWGVASMAFLFWTTKHNVKLDLPPVVDNYKELFDLTLESIRK